MIEFDQLFQYKLIRLKFKIKRGKPLRPFCFRLEKKGKVFNQDKMNDLFYKIIKCQLSGRKSKQDWYRLMSNIAQFFYSEIKSNSIRNQLEINFSN